LHRDTRPLIQQQADRHRVAHQGRDMQRRAQLALRIEVRAIGHQGAQGRKIAGENRAAQLVRFGRRRCRQEQRCPDQDQLVHDRRATENLAQHCSISARLPEPPATQLAAGRA
jgi:hypothetical protein